MNTTKQTHLSLVPKAPAESGGVKLTRRGKIALATGASLVAGAGVYFGFSATAPKPQPVRTGNTPAKSDVKYQREVAQVADSLKAMPDDTKTTVPIAEGDTPESIASTYDKDFFLSSQVNHDAIIKVIQDQAPGLEDGSLQSDIQSVTIPILTRASGSPEGQPANFTPTQAP